MTELRLLLDIFRVIEVVTVSCRALLVSLSLKYLAASLAAGVDGSSYLDVPYVQEGIAKEEMRKKDCCCKEVYIGISSKKLRSKAAIKAMTTLNILAKCYSKYIFNPFWLFNKCYGSFAYTRTLDLSDSAKACAVLKAVSHLQDFLATTILLSHFFFSDSFLVIQGDISLYSLLEYLGRNWLDLVFFLNNPGPKVLQ
ncbi:predicted protein [Aspergillus nidulans FGSC A4]|uniref:Uncharacterized protein n=1 Tax=Emericella nidulans (strain FGSC A4 / ATCC 38163 / CBS 112.46 / NRRL 194 / M139) TaxID=227321 RepID=Q5AU70_EMENI|nr:hypothetical protein [Aspergillus nidulans FGSC A4]EAA59182.1 predicted protein [Aspergillus nidulans FGSC A4]CBF74006.1 TPA: hypothetical protein ANIA_08160 [Aspergillus nidulans FGSC A4]|eukprot:XP_681429.1 predicted protein [Aspergillus nidulans FGSC A4]